MSQQKITIDHNTGEVKIEAIGFSGTSCLAATKQLEQELGIVSDRKTKPEFEKTVSQVQVQRLL